METTLLAGGIVAVVIAVCQAVKYAGINRRFIPLLAILLGLAMAYFFDGVNWLATASGIVLGLTSSGIFSGFKATVLNK